MRFTTQPFIVARLSDAVSRDQAGSGPGLEALRSWARMLTQLRGANHLWRHFAVAFIAAYFDYSLVRVLCV